MTQFNYEAAFSRNLGWTTEEEQQSLRESRVAIAGMGGVGGAHLLTLTRLGVGHFHIADFDSFGVENTNRQAGARVSTYGKKKADTLQQMALDINPELDIKVFGEGVNRQNVEQFFSKVDIYVDGLDFFAFDARELVFHHCHLHSIPAITAAPLGTGAATLAFMPKRMSFEQYFGFKGQTELEKALRFFVGLAPSMAHASYLVDPSRVDLSEQKGPSTIMGCEVCAGVAATQVLKILTGRGRILPAPHGLQYDPFINTVKHTWRPGGYRNPLTRFVMNRVRQAFLAN
ncbi:ThiF family adenylyltransferase [Aestuariirhabdus litorea]|uniref:ThiF family adenylyltransferase n=1 Tax=Aestuariirhabdus litorea TaxID=2528527 RepID=A0A3P3VXP6_9GAMM|nr:ThiF family adenylyltransferase [Aestuariirhabdus litorea]RRJ85453.1 ThiF family adenylyltransferase [Aestuariirhabdus litorea]RWW97805.1 ThiF family adenylyltransferase [Endozoicomonadaceae bacterium GTF-13]